ncbi:MAG TPA: ATP-binding cassette domain-containing protein, partial [Candidatus Limnocylindrales bacterium]|nr:ATP-binding cassette domain-containing protein [Candidatus Limnocylindrales bacterium]
MPSIQVSGLTKRFGESIAVAGIDFSVPDGCFTTLLGPSGCGKTTTLRLLAGFERPDAGEISIGERVVASTRGR